MSRKRKLPPGMWRRGGTYYARFARNGRVIRRALCGDLTAASTMLDDMKARAALGDYGILDNDYPWKDLKTEFMRWSRQHVRRLDDHERAVRNFEEYANPNNVQNITVDTILGFREWRLSAGVTARTVNKDVGILNNMFNKAVKWKRIADNPIAGIKPLPHDTLKKDRRSLTVEEVKRLFDVSPDYLRPVWRMFMCTGIRKSELVELRFSDIDWQGRTITIRPAVAKSKKARTIPLDDEMFGMLCELRDDAKDRQPQPGRGQQEKNFSRDHVFVSQANTPLRNNLLTRFYTYCEKAGVDDAHPGGSVDIHSLRVTFCTLAIEHGGNPKAVQAILGHSTLRMTMDVYSKATDSGKRSVIDALPFGRASAPAHVLSLTGAKRAQNSAQVSGGPKKRYKNRGKRA